MPITQHQQNDPEVFKQVALSPYVKCLFAWQLKLRCGRGVLGTTENAPWQKATGLADYEFGDALMPLFCHTKMHVLCE